MKHLDSQEQWKPIKGFTGRFLVSSAGRVASTKFRADSREYSEKRIKALGDNGRGYLQVSICHKNYYVHRLVAEAFIENPNGFSQVHHIDANTKNNTADNLAWVTAGENIRHAKSSMRRPKAVSKESATGQKYILLRVGSDGTQRFRVYIRQLHFCKQYLTLDDAIRARNEVMQSHGL